MRVTEKEGRKDLNFFLIDLKVISRLPSRRLSLLAALGLHCKTCSLTSLTHTHTNGLNVLKLILAIMITFHLFVW